MSDQRLVDLKRALDPFLKVVDGAAEGEPYDFSVLVDTYLDGRSRLTRIIASIAASRFPESVRDLESIVERLQRLVDDTLRSISFGGEFKIKSYGKTHALLLAYLRSKPKLVARVVELRLIVGDQFIRSVGYASSEIWGSI